MEVFRAVMLTGSMNGAAKLLFISQPAVSRLIAYTEQSLGLQLFVRERGKLMPTPEAERLFKEVGALYDEAMRIDDFARDLALKSEGVLNLCSSPSLALNFLPPVIAQFRARHPAVRIRFHTTLLSDMAHELLSRKVDLAVAVLPVDHPNLVVEPLLKGRMVCIAPQGHELTRQATVSMAEVARHPLILYSRNVPFGQLMAAAFQQAGVNWNAVIDIERAELACAMVRAGAGVAIVDEFSVSRDGWPGVDVRPLKENIDLTLSIVRSRFDQPSRQASAFTALLGTYLRSSKDKQ